MSKLRKVASSLQKEAVDQEALQVGNELEDFKYQLEELVQQGRGLAYKLEEILGSQSRGSFESYIVNRLESMAEDREMFTFEDAIDELKNMEEEEEEEE